MSEKLTKDAIDLSTLSIPRLFGRYFLPTLLGMLSISAMTAIDGIFVGHAVGADGIAAINICVPILMLATGLGLMMGAGCSVVASIHMAQHKLKAARINVTQAWIFATLVIMAMIVPVMLFPSAIARMLGSSAALQPLVREYMLGFMPGELFGVWAALLLFVIRLDGSPRLAMWCNVVSAIANIFLDWFMIVFMGWGLWGAAVASALSMAIGGIIAMWYMLFVARQLRPIPLKWSRRSLLYSVRNIGYQCTIGLSALMGECTMAVLALIGNYVFGSYLGDPGIGAFGIACYYTPFVYMIGNAMAQSAQPIISYNYGCGNGRRVHSTLRVALLAAVVWSVGKCGIRASSQSAGGVVYQSQRSSLSACRQGISVDGCSICVLHSQPHAHRLFPKHRACALGNGVCPAARTLVACAELHNPSYCVWRYRHLARLGCIGDAHNGLYNRLYDD